MIQDNLKVLMGFENSIPIKINQGWVTVSP